MWGVGAVRRIVAYGAPVDMRKAFAGLRGGGKGLREEDPLSGTLVVFINWRDTYVKCLYWDRTGFWLFATRLERGRFRFPTTARKQELSIQVFQLLLDGIELGRHPV
jgi:transposase